MRIIFFLILFLTFVENSYAVEKTCAYKNNQDLEPKGFFREPQDQDGVGWCYAYTLADLLSAKLKKAISATYLSLITTYYSLNTTDPKTGQFFSDQVLINRIKMNPFSRVSLAWDSIIANNNQLCMENEMPSKDRVLSLENSLLKPNWIDLALNSLMIKRKALRNHEKDISDNYEPSSFFNDFISWFNEKILNKKQPSAQDLDNSLCHLFKNSNLKEIKDVIDATNSQSILETIKSLIDKGCQPSVSLDSKFKLEVYPKKDEELDKTELLKSIDRQIDKGHLVSIEYQVDSFLQDTRINFDNSGHASTVVGREMRDGTCGYLIRNSWGMGCSIYKKEVQKNCNPKEGTFWITEEQLSNTTDNSYWIE